MRIKKVIIYIIGLGAIAAALFFLNRERNAYAPVLENSSQAEYETTTAVSNPDPETPKQNTKNEKPSSSVAVFIDQNVPFTAQAPNGDWDDERQQDGCEEASALMAMKWVNGKQLSKNEALDTILKISDYELAKYGEFRDIAVNDIVNWIFKDYFKYDKVAVKKNITVSVIIDELEKGNIILAPMNGQLLGNPYFTAPGPERHMLLIRGYDPAKKQFITNEPGTKRGEKYRYDQDVLFNAILSYETGHHIPVSGTPKDIIIVSK